ncbi:hypothetical protein MJT46_004625 [Ovis ammon polii x Ovis aries]|nr:hypothetical protein MJT46_004625 [Ovis ammon polii x Ovis aries]
MGNLAATTGRPDERTVLGTPWRYLLSAGERAEDPCFRSPTRPWVCPAVRERCLRTFVPLYHPLRAFYDPSGVETKYTPSENFTQNYQNILLRIQSNILFAAQLKELRYHMVCPPLDSTAGATTSLQQQGYKDRKDFAFPQEAPGGSQLQKAQAISVLHEVTQHTFQLFSTESSAAAWDQSLLDKLCAALDQQLTDLQACLRQEEELRGAPLLKEDSSLTATILKVIQKVIQKKQENPCPENTK